MDKIETKTALAALDYKIAGAKQNIADLERNKQIIKSEIHSISISKKSRIDSLQKEIKNTRIIQQKKRKRDEREKERKSFDSSIDSKKKYIQNIDARIASERKKISEWMMQKKAIKLAQEVNKN